MKKRESRRWYWGPAWIGDMGMMLWVTLKSGQQFYITSEGSAVKKGCVLESAFGGDIQDRRNGKKLEAGRPD